MSRQLKVATQGQKRKDGHRSGEKTIAAQKICGTDIFFWVVGHTTEIDRGILVVMATRATR
jgi:hypothetical protein